MKLHLPIGLRAALLAVLFATVTPAYADIQLNIGGTPQQDWEAALAALKIEDDLTLTITDGDSVECYTEGKSNKMLRDSTKVWGGHTTLSISGGSFSMSHMYIDEAHITIDNGGSFTTEGYSELGYGKDVTLVLNDGTVEAGINTYFGTGSNANIILNGGTFTAVKAVTLGQSTATAAANAYIEVNEGATYIDKSAGVIGDNTLRSSTTVGAGSKATIVVNGGEFTKSGGYIGIDCDADITVKNGGRFKLLDTMVTDRGNLYLTVESGGVFSVLGDADLGLPKNMVDGEVVIKVDGGRFEVADGAYYANIADGCKTATVVVDNGGEFYMGQTDDGSWLAASCGSLSITVKGDSVFSLADSRGFIKGKATITLGVDSKSGGSKTGSGTFNHSAGAIAFNETVHIIIGESGAYNLSGGAGLAINGGTVIVDVEKGGVFNQSNGIIANVDSSTATINIAEGGEYNYTGGTIRSTVAFNVEGNLNILDKTFNAPSRLSGSGVVTVQNAAQLALQNGRGSESLHILMKGGSLSGAGSFAGHVDILTAKGMYSDIALGGLQADRIDSIRTNESICLTGLAQGSTLTIKGQNSYMTVGSGNAWMEGTGDSAKKALLQFGGDGSGNIAFESDAKLTLLFNAGEVLSTDGNILHICLTNGTVTGVDVAALNSYFKFGAGWGARIDKISSTSNGELIVSVLVDKSNVWQSSAQDGDMSNTGDKDSIDDFGKVYVDKDADLGLAPGSDATLRHLEGEGNLDITGDADSTVHIENGGYAFDADKENGDTYYTGDITVEGGATLDKTGSKEFTMDGTLTTDGNLTVTEGTFTVGSGSESVVGGGVTALGDGDTNKRGELQVNGYLEVQDDSDLSAGHGSITGSGTLRTNGTLTVGEDVSLNGPRMDLGTTGVLDVTQDADATVGGLSGSGTVKGDLTVKDSTGSVDNVFSGTLQGNLTVGEGANQTLAGLHDSENSNVSVQKDGALTVQGADKGEVNLKSISNEGGAGELTFSAAKDSQSAQAGSNIHLKDDIVFWNDAKTELRFNMNSDDLWNTQAPSALMLTTDGTIYIEKRTGFRLSSLSKSLIRGQATDLEGVLIMQGSAVEVVDKYEPAAVALNTLSIMLPLGENAATTDLSDIVEIVKDDLFYILFETVNMYTDGSAVYLNMKARTTSVFNASAGTYNSRIGAELLWAAQQAGVLQSDADVLPVALSLNNLLQTNPARAERVMSALAGSTVTALGAAQRDALKEQMTRMRWHSAQGDVGKPAPKPEEAAMRALSDKSGEKPVSPAPASSWVHAWVEGTYSYAKLDTRGDESGYRLDAWGGSVGVDMEPDKDLRVGLALTALYGDLEARAMDSAKGDLDSYYLSLYGRYRSGDWGHTILVTGGLNHAKLNRTVDYDTGRYATHSSTDGYGVGALYELSYDIALDEYRSSLLQPFFSASVVHTRMDAFREQGAGGMGLNVDDQRQTTSTLALGARWLESCGADLLGRAALFELRANVAQDLGDRRGDAEVGLQANPAFTSTVVGAKAGRTALQMGASLNVPVSDDAQLYINANADLRESTSSWNASVGVRISF